MSDVTIKGVYRDRFFDAQGQPIFDSGWRSNLIVMSCRVLLAGFMKNEAALGIQSMQVGRGDPRWDFQPPPALDPARLTGLFDPNPYTKAITKANFKYLDENDQEVAGPTNRLQITTRLAANQPPLGGAKEYPLREFALFGQLDKTLYMIDYIRHPLIKKANTVLERKVRLIF